MDNLIETGKIVNTHGIRGEVRLLPWADSPQSLAEIKQFYIGGEPVKVRSARVHKGSLIVSLEGVDSLDDAILLKNKVVSVSRDVLGLEDGKYFVADLIGLNAIDAQTGSTIGKISDILSLPAHNVYVIKNSEREILIPAVDEFIVETDIEQGFVKLKLIEGL